MNMTLITNTTDHRSAQRPAVDEHVAARARDVAAVLHTVHRELGRLPNLRPGPEVDGLFGRLVRLVLDAPDDVASLVLREPTIQAIGPRLRELCAQGETELELTWANRISTSPAPRTELTRFPYLGNYRQLSRMEIGIMASALGGTVRSLALVGAGPLPLSALFFAGDLDVAVDNLDRDPAASAAAARVAHVLGYRAFGFQQVDVANADLSGYDVVVLDALVGTTPEDKRRVLAHLARSMSPGAIRLARSARGLRTLLYPAIDRDALDGFDPLTVVHPVNDVVNSAILARAVGTGE